MNIFLLVMTMMAAAGASAATTAEQQVKERIVDVYKYNADDLVKGPSDYFTGDVTVGKVFASGPHASYTSATVNFAAGARTVWHTHPLGQTLVVLSGEGRVQKEGAPAQKIMPGDVVWIPAGVKHWHGAAPHSPMALLAIQAPDETGQTVTWGAPVTDAEYADK